MYSCSDGRSPRAVALRELLRQLVEQHELFGVVVGHVEGPHPWVTYFGSSAGSSLLNVRQSSGSLLDPGTHGGASPVSGRRMTGTAGRMGSPSGARPDAGTTAGRGLVPGQAESRQAVVQRGKVPEINVAIGADDGQTAAPEVEGQVPQSPGPQREGKQRLETTSRHAAPRDGRRRRWPAGVRRGSGPGTPRSPSCAPLETGAGSEVGEREAADRPALKPDHQAAARPIGHKPPDAPTGKIDLLFQFHRTPG